MRSTAKLKGSSCLAFTLPELLVAIAILGVLASLLLPALSGAKGSAYFVKCKSNTRKLGLALRMYVDDKGFYPRTEPGGPWRHWSKSVNGYLDQPVVNRRWTDNREFVIWPPSVFVCPSDTRRKWHGSGGSYGYNSSGISLNGTVGNGNRDAERAPTGLGGAGVYRAKLGPLFPNPVSESFVISPGEMIAFGDAYEFGQRSPINLKRDLYDTLGYIVREGGVGDLTGSLAAISSDEGGRPTGWKRHRRRLSVVFCDGHVEGLKVQTLFFSKQDKDLRLWNVDNQPHSEVLRYTK